MGSLDAVAAWPVRSVAAGMVLASGENQIRGRPDDVFAWASLSKLAVTLAVLVAVEEGIVSLDEPAGPPGATVAHLLAHASGLAPDGSRVLAQPGRRRIYANAGFDILGALVATRAAMDFGDYLAAAVLEPCRMVHADLPLSAPPSSGMRGTLLDLLALGAELLAPTVVSPGTLANATRVAFSDIDGVLPGFGPQVPCDWGLGVEVKGSKTPHWTGSRNGPETFGHFGQAGGFLWVDPLRRACCVVLTDEPFGGWAREAWPALSDLVCGELDGG
jgi:CubicO group peptidase (beta-lactamase class C family)